MSLVCGFWRDEKGKERISSSLTRVEFRFLTSDWHLTCGADSTSSNGLLFSHNQSEHCSKQLVPCPDGCATTWKHVLLRFGDCLAVHDKNALCASTADCLDAPVATFPLEAEEVGASEKNFHVVDKNGGLHMIDEELHLNRPAFSLSWKIKKMACGMNHVLFLNTIGNIYTQGLGSRGQLGLGDLEPASEPTLVEALDFVSVVDISSGFWHSCCCTDDGDVYVWGWNEHGQLGVACRAKGAPHAVAMATLPLPLELPEALGVVQVACGSRHTALLAASGRHVLAFGWNKFNQVSAAAEEVVDSPVAMQLPRGGRVTAVGAGVWSSWLSWEQSCSG